MATLNIQNRKANLESQISKVVGMPGEITIRGEKEFTFSTEKVSKRAAKKIENFFKSVAKSFQVEHDKECGTFCYLTF